jgi:hypothetical protein
VTKLDKFPEAFERFERRVNVDKIETFGQLVSSFASYGGQRWQGTIKQMDALAREAQRLGIPTHGERERRIFRSYWISQPTWKYETITVRGKSLQRYRDIKTGRFIKKP